MRLRARPPTTAAAARGRKELHDYYVHFPGEDNRYDQWVRGDC